MKMIFFSENTAKCMSRCNTTESEQSWICEIIAIAKMLKRVFAFIDLKM